MTRARDVANIDSILTTKGDIYAASAAFTPTRVQAGANGTYLTADNTQTAGVRWVALEVPDTFATTFLHMGA